MTTDRLERHERARVVRVVDMAAPDLAPDADGWMVEAIAGKKQTPAELRPTNEDLFAGAPGGRFFGSLF